MENDKLMFPIYKIQQTSTKPKQKGKKKTRLKGNGIKGT